MISLLISTPGRAEQLEKSLARLRELTLPAQLVLVDDASDEGERLQRLVMEFQEDTRVRSLYLRNDKSRGSCCVPRNMGLLECTQRRIVFACPEMYFITDVLAELAECPEDRIGMVKRVFYGEDSRDLARLDQLEESGEGTANAPYVAIVSRDRLIEIGGWDEKFHGWGTDDIDLMARLAEIGILRTWQPGTQALHQFHGDGGGVEAKMFDARVNSEYMNTKPMWHGHVDHICSRACRIARGVVIPNQLDRP